MRQADHRPGVKFRAPEADTGPVEGVSNEPQARQPHAVRRVVLPSGKTIEVVYFADSEVDSRFTSDSGHRPPRLPRVLVARSSTRSSGRRPATTAGSCCCAARTASGRAPGSSTASTVERFDEELDRGTEALLTDLKRLMHANMEDEIERFIAALHADAILPMDF